MLNTLEWDTLERRRQAASLTLLYKIQNQTIAVNPDLYLNPAIPCNTRSFHPNIYQIIPGRIQSFSNSFFPRTVIWWNSLPGNIITSPSVEVFRGVVTAHL
jgi:hypothetical protein